MGYNFKARVTNGPRNKTIQASIRQVLDRELATKDGAEAFVDAATSATAFLHSQRMHQVLLERYNPLHDMSTRERHNATARRVGLDMPVEYSKTE